MRLLAKVKIKASIKTRKIDWEPFTATQIDLAIQRLNVQGGGTISAKSPGDLKDFNLPNDLISFEWTQPFLDVSYRLPTPDTFQLAALSAG